MEAWKRRIGKIPYHLRADPVRYAALCAAAVSALFVPPSKEYAAYPDLRVLCLLLSLMLVVAGLQKAGIFAFFTDRMLRLVRNTRTLAFVLVGVCFFGSMLITNDVALITFVPLGIMVLTRIEKRKLLIPVIVLQTVAANLGSMLTPLGSPQNLYLYAVSGMTLRQFLQITAIPTALSFVMLSAALFLIRPELTEPLTEPPARTAGAADSIPWMLLFLVCILAVLRVVPYGAACAVVIVGAVILDRAVLLRADYGLLLTFLFLFVFIGNIKRIPAVSAALSAWVGGQELSAGILLSQVISNVPAAMLLSKFTAEHGALLLGVNLGGLGTLIASMASVISYRLYLCVPGAQGGRYLAVFTAVNVLFLAVLWAASAFYAPAS